jgi:NAD(P)-dependent dehydrogenase (short-subunit alcohol dehydrogenase family)
MTLQGKTAVVTGGRRGIGRAYCEQLATDGANVVVVDIDDASDMIFELPGNGEKAAMVCDVSKPEEISALSATVPERFGRCDIFVNNAATLPMSTLETVTLDLWRRVQATNVEPLPLRSGVRPPHGRGGLGTDCSHGFRSHVGPPDQRHRLPHQQR